MHLFVIGTNLQTDLLQLFISIIMYVVLVLAFDHEKIDEIHNLWEDIDTWKQKRQNFPDLLRAIANVRSFIRTKNRSIPFLHKRLELGANFGEAAVQLLNYTCSRV